MLFSVFWTGERLWSVLGEGRDKVFELRYCPLYMYGRGHIDIALPIVPLDRQTPVEGTREIDGHNMFGFYGGDDMVKVVFCYAFDSKIIHNKCEQYVSGGMAEEAMSKYHLGVAVVLEVGLQLFVG